MKCPKCNTDNVSDSRFCNNCATPLKDDQEEFATIKTIHSQSFDLKRGDLFAGRYEVIEKLGQGGMGTVYRVYDQKIKEVVALKLVKPEIGVNTKTIERFRNELKVARKISHRNICRMFDLGEEGLIHFITMEYVAGEDLKRFIKRAGVLTSGKAISIARQVGEGLAEAHRLDVIHRDLKPQNIMIDQDGNARVMDFGIARFVDTDRLTGSGVMIGTPEYMSPEQAELKDVDKRADIYALGVVLYEMVTGRVPFEGETALSVAMKHKTEIPRNVRELNSLISTDLAAIISKCLEKDPDKRYQTPDELMGDLDQVEKDLSTQERVVPRKPPVKTREITVPIPPARKILIPAAAVILIGLVVVVALKFFPGKSPSDLQQPVGAQVEAEVPDKEASSTRLPPPEATQKAAPEAEKKQLEKTRPKNTPSRPAEPAPSSVPNIDSNSARLSMARMNAAKIQAQKKGVDEKILLYRLARTREFEAQKYLEQENFFEVKTLATVLERVFRILVETRKEKDRVDDLTKYVTKLRRDLEKKSDNLDKSKLYRYARQYEQQAADFQEKNDIENSAKAYIQAAVFLEKFRLASETESPPSPGSPGR